MRIQTRQELTLREFQEMTFKLRDEKAQEIYGKLFDSLPDDGVEQDYIVGLVDEDIIAAQGNG